MYLRLILCTKLQTQLKLRLLVRICYFWVISTNLKYLIKSCQICLLDFFQEYTRRNIP
nr:MAG TPA: hypothetical protein [Caudoviricetes sp.]